MIRERERLAATTDTKPTPADRAMAATARMLTELEGDPGTVAIAILTLQGLIAYCLAHSIDDLRVAARTGMV
jgi:hypothetical protein